MMPKLRSGDLVAPHDLPTLKDDKVAVPDANSVVHLQLRRYAGCPICNLHLRAYTNRHDELVAAGVLEIVVFHSTRADLAAYQADLPFIAVPDPEKRLYREFGVERSIRAIAHPSTWLAAIRGWSPRLGIRSGAGGHLGLPAEFLIGTDGVVLAAKYGSHANDHWEFDTVLALVQQHRQ